MKHFKNSIVLILLIVPVITAQEPGAGTFYYSKGINALENEDIFSAEMFFKKSIEENTDVPSLLELARIYSSEGTISGRRKARALLEKAIWHDYSNIECRLLYASLMENFGRRIAIDEYRKIIEIDSACAPAWYNLGKLKEEEFYEYHNSFFKEGDDPELSYEKFAIADFKEAEKYFLNSLKYDPLNPDTYLHMGFLYEDAGEPEKGITLLENLLTKFPENKDAHLFLGLLYYKNSRIPEAYNEYQNALILMPVSERLDFTYNSVSELLQPVAEDQLAEFTPSETNQFIESFWNASDPLYLTDYNERLLEHYSRVAYANLRFGIKDKPGWRTDRGEIVLRYGEPLNRKRYRPQINAGGRTSVMMKTDIWEYEDMVFGFEDQFWSGNFRFTAPMPGSRYISQYEGDTQAFADYVRTVRFDMYEPKYEGPAFTIPYNIAQFKNLNEFNRTDVYVNYGISFYDTIPESDYEWGLFFKDKYFNSIHESKGETTEFSDHLKVKNDSIIYFVNSVDMTVRPDSGLLAFEIIREADKGVSANHQKFSARKFNSGNLDMSDILLASNINRNSDGVFPLKRNDFNILPNPSSAFTKDENLFIYYELYNLEPDDNKLTDFEQRITIEEVDESSGFTKAVNSFLDIIGIGEGGEKITLSSRYETNEKNSQMYLQIDMSKYEPGEYIITILIKDNNSGSTTGNKTFINWQ